MQLEKVSLAFIVTISDCNEEISGDNVGWDLAKSANCTIFGNPVPTI